MADFGMPGGMAFAREIGFDLTNVRGTQIAAAGSANTKGSYTELLSAANNTINTAHTCVVMTMRGGVANNAFYLLDVAIGGAGSEVVIFPNLLLSTTTVTSGGLSFVYDLPIGIPTGQRISARVQASIAGADAELVLIRSPASFSSPQPAGVLEAIGADTSGTGGVTVARSTAGVFGSYVEMIASTARNYRGFIVAAIRNSGSYSSATSITFNLAVGSAGNEEIILDGWQLLQSNTEGMWGTTTPFIGVSIAAGQRLAIQAASNLNNSDADLDYIIYGVS